MSEKDRQKGDRVIKIFISQPMKGKTNKEIEEERAKIAKYCKQKYKEVELIDSFFVNYEFEPERKPLWYLGESIINLSDADIAVFAPGWQKARGCVVEALCACKYGIAIMDLEEELDFDKN